MTEQQIGEINTAKKSRRFGGIDIVKILASFFVVLVHFYLNTAFYTAIPVTETAFYKPILVFWIAYTGVPLFLISTGFLMKNKTLSKKYYLGLIRVVVLYLVCSLICLLWRMYHYDFNMTGWNWLKGFLQFSHCDYAWYVEFYIILFLLIPFLNNAYNGLKSQKEKLVLVATTFVLLIFAPSFFIGTSGNEIQPLPTYMLKSGLFAYYFLGCYLREFPPRKSRGVKLTMLGVLATSLLHLTYTSYHASINNNGQIFSGGHFFQYDSYPLYFCSAAIFILLFDIEIRTKTMQKVLGFLSSLTLSTYLLSYLYDLKFYAKFNLKYPYTDYLERFRHLHEIVPKVWVLALLTAAAVEVVYRFCDKSIREAFHRQVEAAEAEAEKMSKQ